jgi:hypothetical protein
VLLRGIQIYSDADDLANNLDLSGVTKVQNRGIGGGIGQKAHDAIPKAAPAAVVSLAMFEEVNGTFALTVPAAGLDLPLGIVHYEKGARGNSGMHAPVFGTHERIAITPHIDASDQGQRQFAPSLHNLTEEKRPSQIDPGIEGDGEISLAGIFLGEVHGMGLFNMDKSDVGRHGVDGNAIPGEYLVQIEAVYAAEGVQAIDRGQRTLVFDIGEAADQDHKLLISMPLRDQLAGLLDIAEAQVQTFAGASEALSGVVRAMILSLDKACGRVWHVSSPFQSDYNFATVRYSTIMTTFCSESGTCSRLGAN